MSIMIQQSLAFNSRNCVYVCLVVLLARCDVSIPINFLCCLHVGTDTGLQYLAVGVFFQYWFVLKTIKRSFIFWKALSFRCGNSISNILETRLNSHIFMCFFFLLISVFLPNGRYYPCYWIAEYHWARYLKKPT